MGANFLTKSFGGHMTRKEVKTSFAHVQDDDRYENGHSYSGGFGMARGLKFADQTFDNQEAAEEWLDENCEKWEEAIAVTFKDKLNKTQWLIGAICAS